jgi:hypothetical protein
MEARLVVGSQLLTPLIELVENRVEHSALGARQQLVEPRGVASGSVALREAQPRRSEPIDGRGSGMLRCAHPPDVITAPRSPWQNPQARHIRRHRLVIVLLARNGWRHLRRQAHYRFARRQWVAPRQDRQFVPFHDRSCLAGQAPSCCIREKRLATPQCSVILPSRTRMTSTVSN